MNDALKFIADRLAEKTTWAALLGLASAASLVTGVSADSEVLTNLAAVGAIIAGVVGILTKEKPTP